MKRVILVGPPFSGHLHPLLGIARHLAPRAEVLLVSTPRGVADARASGIPARPILARYEARVLEIAEPQREVRNHPHLLWRQLRDNVALMAPMQDELGMIFDEIRPDLVIADFVVPVAGLAATARGIPWWTSLVSPCVFETPDGPPGYFGGQLPARTPAQAAIHAAMRRGTRLFKRTLAFLLRRRLRPLGFRSVYRRDGSETIYSPECILALGIREIEFERSYPDHLHFVGPVLHTPPTPTPDPVFPDDGRPVVLATLGTHLPQAKQTFSELVRRTADAHPEIVFHFTQGTHGSVERRIRGNFHIYDHISYERHLGRYDAVIHHAGAGATYHCLRHGIPAVVHPVDFDQFDFAARLVSAGLAVRGDPANLSPAVLAALSDPAIRERSRTMSRIQAGYTPEHTIESLIDQQATT